MNKIKSWFNGLHPTVQGVLFGIVAVHGILILVPYFVWFMRMVGKVFGL